MKLVRPYLFYYRLWSLRRGWDARVIEDKTFSSKSESFIMIQKWENIYKIYEKQSSQHIKMAYMANNEESKGWSTRKKCTKSTGHSQFPRVKCFFRQWQSLDFLPFS